MTPSSPSHAVPVLPAVARLSPVRPSSKTGVCCVIVPIASGIIMRSRNLSSGQLEQPCHTCPRLKSAQWCEISDLLLPVELVWSSGLGTACLTQVGRVIGLIPAPCWRTCGFGHQGGHRCCETVREACLEPLGACEVWLIPRGPTSHLLSRSLLCRARPVVSQSQHQPPARQPCWTCHMKLDGCHGAGTCPL